MIELCFNLGLTGLLGFKKMIDALTRKNYPEAVKQLLDSRWATQIGKSRIDDITYRLGVGRYK